MGVIKKSWQNFKTQPDVWFFYGFLLTFTLSIRKVLSFYPIRGEFNEYTGIYLYLSDIFLILTLILWLISILCNKNTNLSIYRRLFNALNKPSIFLPLLLVVWSFISIFWSQNPTLALFRSFKLLELYFLYIYLILKIPRFGKKELLGFLKIIVVLGFIQALIGIIQFILQHSVGIFWLKESLISPYLPGIAKIILNGHKFIRAYGLFPHPNILGGFLVFSILITLFYKKTLLPCHSESRLGGKESNPIRSLDRARDDNRCSTWNINQPKLLSFFIFIQIIGLILTFSKSAILGLIIASAFIYFKRKTNVPLRKECSTWNILKGKHGTLIKQVVIISLIIILAFFLIKPDIYSFFIKSLNERYLYLDVSRGTILANPIIGLGMGQFVLEMQNYSRTALEIWQFQPVHNVFLLIWAELGIWGLFIFIYFLWKLFHIEQFKIRCHSERSVSEVEESNPIRSLDRARDDNRCEEKINCEALIYFKSILLTFLFIMLFDHYFWDIQQGQIMIWMVMGIVVGNKSFVIKESFK